jgi:hypothetical protein
MLLKTKGRPKKRTQNEPALGPNEPTLLANEILWNAVFVWRLTNYVPSRARSLERFDFRLFSFCLWTAQQKDFDS